MRWPTNHDEALSARAGAAEHVGVADDALEGGEAGEAALRTIPPRTSCGSSRRIVENFAAAARLEMADFDDW